MILASMRAKAKVVSSIETCAIALLSMIALNSATPAQAHYITNSNNASTNAPSVWSADTDARGGVSNEGLPTQVVAVPPGVGVDQYEISKAGAGDLGSLAHYYGRSGGVRLASGTMTHEAGMKWLVDTADGLDSLPGYATNLLSENLAITTPATWSSAVERTHHADAEPTSALLTKYLRSEWLGLSESGSPFVLAESEGIDLSQVRAEPASIGLLVVGTVMLVPYRRKVSAASMAIALRSESRQIIRIRTPG